MTMTEAVLGARQKHKRSCEGGQSGHPELRARVGLLSPSLPPSTLSVSRRPQVSVCQPQSGLEPTPPKKYHCSLTTEIWSPSQAGPATSSC